MSAAAEADGAGTCLLQGYNAEGRKVLGDAITKAAKVVKDIFCQEMSGALEGLEGKERAAKRAAAAAKAARNTAPTFSDLVKAAFLRLANGKAAESVSQLRFAADAAKRAAAEVIYSPWLSPSSDNRNVVESLLIDLVNVKEEHWSLLGGWAGKHIVLSCWLICSALLCWRLASITKNTRAAFTVDYLMQPTQAMQSVAIPSDVVIEGKEPGMCALSRF
jgi:hypothetical protein